MGYKQEAIRGISWMSAFRVITRGLSFSKTLVLARILTPSQFGIFGIASLVLELLEILTETGINIFLIQSKGDIHKYVNSAWVVSILRGCIISICIIIFSPFISLFFHSNAALPILLFISTIPFVRGFINPAVVKLQKDLQFKYEFWFRSTIFFFDAFVTIILALITQSVYSLVWGPLAGALLEVILSFVLITPRPAFVLHRGYFSEIFHKGKWVTLYGVLNYFAQRGDNIVVGRVMGASFLGIYEMAYKVSTLPISEICDTVSKVVFPVFAKIEHDRQRLKNAFLKTTAMISLFSILMGSVIFIFPKEVILLLLGDKWLSAVSVLQVLVLYGVLRAISGSASTLFLAVGKQKYVTGMTFIRFTGLALTIYPFVVTWGLVGAGYSALLSVLVEIPVIGYLTYRILRGIK